MSLALLICKPVADHRPVLLTDIQARTAARLERPKETLPLSDGRKGGAFDESNQIIESYDFCQIRT